MPLRLSGTLRVLLDLLLNALVVIVAVVVIRSYIISPFQVYGPSMCDTFNIYEGQCVQSGGEYLILNKAVYQNFFGFRYRLPARGDVIIFRPPSNGQEFFIKRIIGLPGEKILLKNGGVYVVNVEHLTGVRLLEPYLSEQNQGKTFPSAGKREFLVPEDHYFVLGDNRQASSDSRRCFSDFGCGTSQHSPYLSREAIEGKALVVLWPLSHLRLIPDVAYAGS